MDAGVIDALDAGPWRCLLREVSWKVTRNGGGSEDEIPAEMAKVVRIVGIHNGGSWREESLAVLEQEGGLFLAVRGYLPWRSFPEVAYCRCRSVAEAVAWFGEDGERLGIAPSTVVVGPGLYAGVPQKWHRNPDRVLWERDAKGRWRTREFRMWWDDAGRAFLDGKRSPGDDVGVRLVPVQEYHRFRVQCGRTIVTSSWRWGSDDGNQLCGRFEDDDSQARWDRRGACRQRTPTGDSRRLEWDLVEDLGPVERPRLVGSD
jgi:hypothetical protein